MRQPIETARRTVQAIPLDQNNQAQINTTTQNILNQMQQSILSVTEGFQAQKIMAFLIKHDQWKTVVENLDSALRDNAYLPLFTQACASTPPAILTLAEIKKARGKLLPVMYQKLETSFVTLCAQKTLIHSIAHNLQDLQELKKDIWRILTKMLAALGKP